jgi:hypothetical protein
LGHLSFSVNPAPPFRLDLTVWAIRRRPQNAVDHWDGETHRRVLAIRGKPVLTTVAQLGDVNAPRLDVTASCAYIPTVARSAVTAALDRLLGLHVDLKPFYQLAAEHSPLHELASRFRGLKPPRFPTVWEGLVNGIACQQFSLTVGIQSHPEKWLEFRRRYFAELDRLPDVWAPIREAARKGTVTLLYSSHDTEHNNAVALKDYIERKSDGKTRTAGGRTRH